MSVFAAKALSLLIHPLVVALLLLSASWALAWRWPRIGQVLMGMGLLVLVVPSLPPVADALYGSLEQAHPPIAARALPTADAIVVLGGGVGAPVPPRIDPDFNDASDRIVHAFRLYQADRAPRIVVSGGRLPWADTPPEAFTLRRVLMQWGVPESAIWTEPESATTYENAQRTADLLRERDFDRVLLVTSAAHMARALAVFCTAGVPAVPAPTDHRVVQGPGSALGYVPSAAALSRSTGAIREYVGYAVYRLRGWIAPDAVTTSPLPSDATGVACTS